jgi:hypothetical protein
MFHAQPATMRLYSLRPGYRSRTLRAARTAGFYRRHNNRTCGASLEQLSFALVETRRGIRRAERILSWGGAAALSFKI